MTDKEPKTQINVFLTAETRRKLDKIVNQIKKSEDNPKVSRSLVIDRIVTEWVKNK